MKMKKLVSLLIALVLVIGCIATALAQEPVTIRLTEYNASFLPHVKEAVEEYIAKAKENGVIFEWTTGNGGELRTKVKAEFAAGNPPDMFSWNPGANFVELVAANQLEEIHDYFDHSALEGYDTTWYDDSAWAGVTLDGEQYWGLPITTQYTGLIANKSLFEKYNLSYPTTYAELLEVAEVFKANGIYTLGIGSKNGNPSQFTFDSILHQFMDPDYSAGWLTGETKFDCPEVVLAASYIQDMQNRGVMTDDPVGYGEWTTCAELFNTEKAAIITVHPWTVTSIKLDPSKIDLIDWWTYPETKYDPKDWYLGGTHDAFVITKASYEDPAKRQAIQDFCEWYTSDVVEIARNLDGTMSPRNPETLSYNPADYLPELPARIMEINKTKKSCFYTWGRMPNSAVAVEYQKNFCDPLWAGLGTAEEIVAQMQATMDQAYVDMGYPVK